MEGLTPTARYEYAVLVTSTTHEVLTITSTHAKQAVIQATLTRLASFLNSLENAAEQLTEGLRLRAILARAFAKFILPIPAPPPLLLGG